MNTTEKRLLGRAEKVRFPDISLDPLNARIDTGARKSAIWVSYTAVIDNELQVIFFDKNAVGYTGKIVKFKQYDRIAVASSTGHIDKRYAVKLLVVLKGKKIRATFTLANRSSQVYPVLIGRNVLRGKFIVDVAVGKALIRNERQRIAELQKTLEEGDL